MAETRFPHGLYYPDAHSLSLSDIAATLTAHEHLIPVVAGIISKSIDGVSVHKITIELEDIKRSSLSESFFVAIFLVFQEDLEKEVPDAIQALTGHTLDPRFDTLVTVLFMVALYYGTMRLLGKGGKHHKKLPSSLEGDYRNYITIAANTLNVTPQVIERAVEEAVTKQKQPSVMRAAIDLFRPAKRGGNGRIVPMGLPEIPAAHVADFPNEVALAELDDDNVPIPIDRGLIKLRALDRDKSDRGWAGSLTSEILKTKRLPLKLYPTIDREYLASLKEVSAEAIVECKMMDDGSLKPKRIHLLKVLD